VYKLLIAIQILAAAPLFFSKVSANQYYFLLNVLEKEAFLFYASIIIHDS
jgi:hypothetical protein